MVIGVLQLVWFGAAAASPHTADGVSVPKSSRVVGSVYLPEMTTNEVRDALAGGWTTVIIPTGGIEDNGPFLVLGKHDQIIREVAERTARRLGDTLVAPVVSFVPEGRIRPPTGHMRHPGTISARPSTFEAVLEDSIRSLAAHGFEHVVLMGDSGGNQEVQAGLAARLDGGPARVHHLDAFYDPAAANRFLEGHGISWTPDAHHDDPGFTLQLLAIDREAARWSVRKEAGRVVTDGFSLEPIEDRVALGDALLDWRAKYAAEDIRAARQSSAPSGWGVFVEGLLSPVQSLVRPTERIFLGYLLTALWIAILAEAWNQGRAWSIRSVARALFPTRVWLSRDAGQDALYALFGGVFLFGWLSGAWPALSDLGERVALGALRLSGIDNLGLRNSVALAVFTTLFLVILSDLAVYLGHWAQHRIPILWTFHKVHHSARNLTPLTIFRVHPVDLLLLGALGSLFMGVASGVLLWASEEPIGTLQIYGINAVIVGFYLLGYNLRHTHIWVSFGPLQRVFVSPAMHQIHHSEAPRHWDRNLGLTFSVWDQIFGTAYLPREREELVFGIGPESERYGRFIDFWLEPARELLRRDPISGGAPRPDHGDGHEPPPPPSRRESP